MAGPQEKKAVAIEVESNDKKKKGKKKGKKGKKAKEAVVELSEEDEAMKNALELAVRRVQDKSAVVQKAALKTLRDTIKSATSAMTSVPKPLKFLAPHYRNLVSYFDEKLVTQSANKTELADILALVAMSMSNGKKYNRDSLRFKLQGSRGDLGAWGDEFVRNLAGELGQEYGERTSSEPPVDTADLLVLVDEVLTFNMNHNAEADSVDMLMEVQQLSRLLDERLTSKMDARNAERLCNYLMRCAKYESDPDERQNVYKTSFELFMKHKKASDALRCAIKMNNDELVKRVFEMPSVKSDTPMRKQLCFILGRQRAFTFQLDEDEDDDASELNEIIGNYSILSDHFRRLATTLDVQDAKTPEEVYKSHLGDSGRTGLNADGAAVESARQNAASTYVNGFVNVGYGKDKLITAQGDDGQNVWLYKNKDRGMHSAAASLGMVYQWDVDEGFGALDRFLYVDNINIKAGAVLGIGVCNAGVYNAEVDAAIGLLPDYLTDDTKLSSDGNSLLKVSALLAFGLSYVGTCREEVQDLVEPFIEGEDISFDVTAIAAISLGMVFVGSGDEDVATSLIERLLSASDAELDTPGARFLCLAVGLVFLGREEAADATLEVFKTIENKIGHFAILTVKTCAYAGSGNVLKVQEMLHVCAEHLDENNAAYHQMVATLGVALLSVGEEVGSAMAMRTMEHLLQYGELPVKRAVPLAIALLHVSDPDFSVVDTVSKLSHDSDDAVAQNAILALGIISAGTNNSRVAGLLRQLSSFYKKQANHLYIVRIAQGLLHMGKGLVTLNPAHSGGLLASNASLAGLLVVLFAAFDQKNTLLDKMHYLLYSLCTACVPRMLVTLDEELNPLKVQVRVGESVDVVGQAGNPRAITGFQTFDTPVLMSTGDRAELVGEEYEPLTSVIEGFVILRKKKNKNTDGESKE